jgi:hypothetical protein
MGRNSIFDDIGLGAVDLGLAPDEEKIKKEQQAKINQEEARIAKEKETAEAEAGQRAEEARMSRSRSRTILTSARGLEDEDDQDVNVSRRTLLGS